jgi:hypothetical protein
MSWILVIAGNQHEHNQWERVHPTGRYVYLKSPDSLKGICIDTVILTGRWWQNPVLKKHGGWDMLRPYFAHRCHVDTFKNSDITIEASL